jgi:hypothetical protein
VNGIVAGAREGLRVGPYQKVAARPDDPPQFGQRLSVATAEREMLDDVQRDRQVA